MFYVRKRKDNDHFLGGSLTKRHPQMQSAAICISSAEPDPKGSDWASRAGTLCLASSLRRRLDRIVLLTPTEASPRLHTQNGRMYQNKGTHIIRVSVCLCKNKGTWRRKMYLSNLASCEDHPKRVAPRKTHHDTSDPLTGAQKSLLRLLEAMKQGPSSSRGNLCCGSKSAFEHRWNPNC